MPYPEGTSELDYELEVAAIVGLDGQIGGFTVMNDWSARDLQRRGDEGRPRPREGQGLRDEPRPGRRHPDEFDGRHATMTARVNGEERSRGYLGDMHWSWQDLFAQAARSTRLIAGDVIGSGTVGTGCILEHGDGRWLQPGDVVELEVEGIGVLRNTIA